MSGRRGRSFGGNFPNAGEGPAHTVRAAIDEVTHKAATVSRASDMLVHDRVDELTQVFVENVATLLNVKDTTEVANALRKRTPPDDNLEALP